MEDSLWREPGSPELLQAIASVQRLGERTRPLGFPPGVYKHRSIEDGERLREEWEETNFREFWRLRGLELCEVGRRKAPTKEAMADRTFHNRPLSNTPARPRTPPASVLNA